MQPHHDRRFTQPARDAAKAAARAFGAATSRWREGPDFIIIGAKRAGTTSLFRYLQQHPGVLPLFPARQRIKGIHHFTAGSLRGDAWYESHFPTRFTRRRVAARLGHPVVVGEANPYYLFHPLAPERVASALPDVRLIALLRDPVERAYSHWRERVRHGAEPLSLREAVARESDRLAGELERIRAGGYDSWTHEHQSYLNQGLYAPAIRAWLNHFPTAQLLVLASEDLYAEPQSVCDRVTAYLGLPSWTLRDIRRWNYHPAPELDSEIRRELEARFEHHNRELEHLLGMSFGWTET